jgi:hypothetical protein
VLVSSEELSGSALVPLTPPPAPARPQATIKPAARPAGDVTEVSLDELGSWSESTELTDSEMSGSLPPESSSAAASPPSLPARTSPGRAAAPPDSDRRGRPAVPPPPRTPGNMSAVRAATTGRRAGLRAGSSATRVAAYGGARRQGSSLAPLASILGFLCLFGAGVFLGTRASSPAAAQQPEAAGARAEQDELVAKDPTAALEAAHAYARLHPEDPGGVVARFEHLALRLPEGTPAGRAARAGLGEARRRLEEQAAEAVDGLGQALCELVEAKRWPEAEARLRAFPEAFRGTPAWERFEELKREVETLRRAR